MGDLSPNPYTMLHQHPVEDPYRQKASRFQKLLGDVDARTAGHN